MKAPVPASDLTAAQLVELLQAPNEDVRVFGVLRLRTLGPQAAAAVPSLLALLNSPSATDRRAAAWALEAIGPATRAATRALQRVLDEDDDINVCKFAAAALRRIAPESADEWAA